MCRIPWTTRRASSSSSEPSCLRSSDRCSGAFLAGFYGRGLTDTEDALYSHRIRFANTARTLSLFDAGLLERARAEDDPLARLLRRLPERF